MSTILDALKKAQEQAERKTAKPVSPGSVSAVRVRFGAGVRMIQLAGVLTVLLLVGGVFGIWFLRSREGQTGTNGMPHRELRPAAGRRVENMKVKSFEHLRVEGILWDPETPMAIVSGRLVRVGDAVGGMTVMAVTEESVTVRSQDGKETVLECEARKAIAQ